MKSTQTLERKNADLSISAKLYFHTKSQDLKRQALLCYFKGLSPSAKNSIDNMKNYQKLEDEIGKNLQILKKNEKIVQLT